MRLEELLLRRAESYECNVEADSDVSFLYLEFSSAAETVKA
jgi:hypothetical protein